MGRRSINTTKSGKYMNPTDQARKEARKKELKKNKRQRQMVRAAVLKNKDPSQILEEMEKIDEMEYNVLQPSPLNEKVLRDKRKKLKETFDRVMRLYHTEEPEHWAELKRKEVEYEKRRLKKQQYYESVKHAQSVQIDEIPLPSATPTTTSATTTSLRLPPPPSALSLPPFAPGAPPSALRKPTDILGKLPETSEAALARDKSGVPVGPPPDLLDMRELDSDAEDDEVILKKYVPKSVKAAAAKAKALAKPNSLQQRMLALSGQNIDEFMREMENVHKKKEKERQAARGSNQKSRSDQDDDDDKSNNSSDNEERRSRVHSSDSEENDDSADSDVSQDTKRARRESKFATSAKPASTATAAAVLPMPMPLPPSGLPPHVTVPGPPMPPVGGMPPAMLFRPPPLRPHGGMTAFGIRMPPGPPPGPRPRAPSMGGMPPRMGIRMPPGPPPGMPPRMAQHHKNMQQQQQQQLQQQKDSSKGVTTITAKPQIRNLSADVTRFVPSALRVKREETRKPNRTKPYAQEHTSQTAEGSKAATKDDAYMQFMNEMQGLL